MDLPKPRLSSPQWSEPERSEGERNGGMTTSPPRLPPSPTTPGVEGFRIADYGLGIRFTAQIRIPWPPTSDTRPLAPDPSLSSES